MEYIDKMYKCECGCEGLTFYKDTDNTINISIWSYGIPPMRNSLRYRLRHIWNIIKKGTPYSDFICLSKETAQKFIDDLQKDIGNVK